MYKIKYFIKKIQFEIELRGGGDEKSIHALLLYYFFFKHLFETTKNRMVNVHYRIKRKIRLVNQEYRFSSLFRMKSLKLYFSRNRGDNEIKPITTTFVGNFSNRFFYLKHVFEKYFVLRIKT